MNFDIFLLKYTHLYDSLKVKVKISITIIPNPNLLLYLQYESNIIMNKSRKKKNILYIHRLKCMEIETSFKIKNRSRLVFSSQGEPFLDPTALDRFAFLQMLSDKFIDAYTLPCGRFIVSFFTHTHTRIHKKYIYIFFSTTLF